MSFLAAIGIGSAVLTAALQLYLVGAYFVHWLLKRPSARSVSRPTLSDDFDYEAAREELVQGDGMIEEAPGLFTASRRSVRATLR